MIRRSFPEHGIIGEEFGAERADAEYVWVLDPIDGTKSFISGMPVWGTLIALTRFGEPVFGMMHQPFTRETLHRRRRRRAISRAGRRARPAGAPLRPRLCDAVLFTTSPLLMNDGRPRPVSATSRDRVKLSRYGGDCYAYCMLAAGHIDLVIETELKPYDIVAADPDHHRRRRDRDLLGWRPPVATTGHRGRRQRRTRAARYAATQRKSITVRACYDVVWPVCRG